MYRNTFAQYRLLYSMYIQQLITLQFSDKNTASPKIEIVCTVHHAQTWHGFSVTFRLINIQFLCENEQKHIFVNEGHSDYARDLNDDQTMVYDQIIQKTQRGLLSLRTVLALICVVIDLKVSQRSTRRPTFEHLHTVLLTHITQWLKPCQWMHDSAAAKSSVISMYGSSALPIE